MNKKNNMNAGQGDVKPVGAHGRRPPVHSGASGGPGKPGPAANKGNKKPGMSKPGMSKPGPLKPPGPGGQPRPAPPKPGPAQVIEVRPQAAPATMKRRHWGLLLSFSMLVMAPLVVAGWYLYFVSTDQYASTVGFTVRTEEAGSTTDLMGGLAMFSGAGASSDADVLYEFIQSQEIVEKINATLDIGGHYSVHWDTDPVFSIWPEADIEDLLWFWPRIVRVSYDQSTGLISLQTRAFDPDMAQQIGQEIVRESQIRINELNESARADMMRYAEIDLGEALTRLKLARESLTQFRIRTRIVDPEADIQVRMGVFNNLQQQLAQALVDYDILRETVSSSDPRLVNGLRRIEVIQDRIRQERYTFAVEKLAGGDADYPTVLAEFESLTVDREFAEETYRVALAAFDIARDNASRQSRYLATYIRPTLAQSSKYPQHEILLALAALFLLMVWATLALVYYSLRDRR